MRQVVIALVLVLAGCATGYRPQRGPAGIGYSEMRINEREFEVRYSGAAGTSPATARDGAIRRAAELTLASHREAFVIVADRSAQTTHMLAVDDVAQMSQRPAADITIRMLAGAEAQEASDRGLQVYDARTIVTGATRTAQR